MKKPLMVVLFVAAIAAGVMSPWTACAEPANSFNLGIGGVIQTMPHCKATIYIVEYEHMLYSKTSLLGRGCQVDYKFDDGTYFEVGRPRGVDIGARYYPAVGMKASSSEERWGTGLRTGHSPITRASRESIWAKATPIPSGRMWISADASRWAPRLSRS
jgi:hypothetical protein